MGQLSDAAVAGVYQAKQGDLSDRTQRGDAGRRQVQDASLAFLNGLGGADQAFCSTILGRT
jgi:hypothetical protein